MKRIIAVASGKGGVGKSTVAANLAVTFANYPFGPEKRPLKVALIDVDFYGPSIPTIMGGGQVVPNEEGAIVPAERHNVKYISIAFFLRNADDPVIWRGPRFGKAMEQLFNDVAWGDIDICIVDMPPGTGDSQLSLSQVVELSGAVVVTTPQEVALADVRRAINMFSKVNVPVVGVVENMAGFQAPDGSIINIFGEGGGQALAQQYNVPFLGSLPLDIKVREGGDIGMPIALDVNNKISKLYYGIAEQLLENSDSAIASRCSVKIDN